MSDGAGRGVARCHARIWRGMAIALFSGVTYGLYSALILAAQTRGVWAGWALQLSANGFLAVFILPTIAAAVNDLTSAAWSLGITIHQGKLGDYIQAHRTRTGAIMVAAALVGGPIAGAAYVVALSMAGPIVTPVAALCPAIGAILSRLFLKQPLGAKAIAGILVCMLASGMIGAVGLTGELGPQVVPGLCLALVAALGWGIEGCVGGFCTESLDAQIGITIRQVVSSFANLCCVLPVLALLGGVGPNTAYGYVAAALADPGSMLFFVASGYFAYASFASWYRGNSMCGTALGMACNGTYSFFVPLFSWLIVGVVLGVEGLALPVIAWVAALVMVAGIALIALQR